MSTQRKISSFYSRNVIFLWKDEFQSSILMCSYNQCITDIEMHAIENEYRSNIHTENCKEIPLSQ